ncbi:NADH-quinone oxidoreductase subunit C [Acetobacter persici]|uniref:NADH-quinone oxidoreductase subunit C n=1 Tax=Acetobacter persici TaxID=1076596 RepID=A0A6V8I7R3_9PROT|nr:NADH-quinone oxidoreductase subunit C [Acetobacter persici]OUI90448.1 NADH-quinone oxidoreductase [Acetobacter persici]GFE92646.1 NADH-quinone oxidoreductase subunit C [Acetobacter persici]
MAEVSLPAPQQTRLQGRLGALAFSFATSWPGISSAGLEGGELVVRTTRDQLLPLMTFLRDAPHCRFEQMMDLCGVDYPSRAERFDVVYNLLSVTHNQRIRVIITTDAATPVVSVAGLWPSACWWERECYDLFGVQFLGNPDMRRILTDDGFEDFPLRKDFPLTGYEEVRYDVERREVVKEPVSLVQDFRNFDFVSPWEGMLTLPGDEKAHEVRQHIKRSRG